MTIRALPRENKNDAINGKNKNTNNCILHAAL
jgi:hypothetical protein